MFLHVTWLSAEWREKIFCVTLYVDLCTLDASSMYLCRVQFGDLQTEKAKRSEADGIDSHSVAISEWICVLT